MTAISPDQIWWTTEEIAASGLPDLPSTRQGVDAVAARLNWRSDPHHARRRSRRGGGWEYHWKLFPSSAQKKLLAAVSVARAPERPERDEAWAWFETLPQVVQGKARSRLLTLQRVDAMRQAGMTKFLAVHQIADLDGVSARTIWDWLQCVEGVRSDDWLPYLAPRHRAARRKARRAEMSPEFFDAPEIGLPAPGRTVLHQLLSPRPATGRKPWLDNGR